MDPVRSPVSSFDVRGLVVKNCNEVLVTRSRVFGFGFDFLGGEAC